ncbi:mCG140640, isoform CRA_a, partial [Mus musculus]
HFASKQRTAVLRPHAPPQGPWSSTGAALAPAHRGARPVPERKRKRRAAGSSSLRCEPSALGFRLSTCLLPAASTLPSWTHLGNCKLQINTFS